MNDIACRRCNYNEDESKVHLHHIIPKDIGGKDSDGRKYLCHKCHHIWHNMLPGIIWVFVPNDTKEKAKDNIRMRFKYYIK